MLLDARAIFVMELENASANAKHSLRSTKNSVH